MDRKEVGRLLFVAVKRANFDEMKRLLDLKGDVHHDHNGLNVLHQAAKKGHAKIIKTLVKKMKLSVHTKDKYGWTPLHWACWAGHPDCVQALLDCKANPNSLDKIDANCVHGAAINGHANVIRVLAQSSKCDFNVQRKDGWAPIHLTSHNGHVEAVRALVTDAKCKVNLETEGGEGPLHKAVTNGHYKIVEILLAAGAPIDMPDKFGCTALHDAVQWGQKRIVRLLLEADCRVTAKNNKNKHTPLDLAKLEGQTEIAQLLDAGINAKETTPELASKWSDVRKLLFVNEDGKLKFNHSESKWQWKKRMEETCETYRRSSQEKIENVERQSAERVDATVRQCDAKIDEIKQECARRISQLEQRLQEKERDLVETIERRREMKRRAADRAVRRNGTTSAPKFPLTSKYRRVGHVCLPA
ncbi:putative ankyrin repeat protein RF_0381 [Oscarella lobularis]|uniref:putative ankyrin repeat protein RF_0381 n=1 Tax=Oscarella lobularis TaxID=121494 RepID=UPI003313C221